MLPHAPQTPSLRVSGVEPLLQALAALAVLGDPKKRGGRLLHTNLNHDNLIICGRLLHTIQLSWPALDTAGSFPHPE